MTGYRVIDGGIDINKFVKDSSKKRFRIHFGAKPLFCLYAIY